MKIKPKTTPDVLVRNEGTVFCGGWGYDPYRDAAAAEYVAVEARNPAPQPQAVDHVHAAALPPPA